MLNLLWRCRRLIYPYNFKTYGEIIPRAFCRKLLWLSLGLCNIFWIFVPNILYATVLVSCKLEQNQHSTLDDWTRQKSRNLIALSSNNVTISTCATKTERRSCNWRWPVWQANHVHLAALAPWRTYKARVVLFVGQWNYCVWRYRDLGRHSYSRRYTCKIWKF